MDLGLKDKVVVVTGAARGIGRAVATAFANEGARVVCVDVRADDVEETVAAIDAAGGKATAELLDITDRGAVRGSIASLEERLGAVDVIVNNAAWVRYQALEEIDEATVDRMLATGLKAILWLVQAASPGMAKRGGGAIVNLCSSAAFRATPASAAYCAVKAGVAGLTRQLAVDLGGQHIRVNAIAPGFIETAAAVRNVGEEGIRRRTAVTPLGRNGRTTDIAELAVYLASTRAGYVTGEVILADGGRANAAL